MNEQIFWDNMSPAGWRTAGQGRHGVGEPHCSEACVRLKLSFTRTNSGIFCWFSRCLISSCSYWKKKHTTTKTSLGSKIVALLRQYLDCYGMMLSRCCCEQQLHGQKLPDEAETRESFLAWLLLKRLAQFLFANFHYIFIFSHWARNNEQTTQPAFIWRDFFFHFTPNWLWQDWGNRVVRCASPWGGKSRLLHWRGALSCCYLVKPAVTHFTGLS